MHPEYCNWLRCVTSAEKMKEKPPCKKQSGRQLIGVLPAAGKGERIAPLPCSKELFPVGFQKTEDGDTRHPKVVSHYLLEKMQAVGANKAFIVLRAGKWDIPAYFGDGEIVDMHLAYLMMNRQDGAPFTLDQAYPFLENDIVLFGFPDILFRPVNAFDRLLVQQEKTEAEIVLGLFPADKPYRFAIYLDNSCLDAGVQPFYA